jgi:hypothetical protein
VLIDSLFQGLSNGVNFVAWQWLGWQWEVFEDASLFGDFFVIFFSEIVFLA